MIEKLTQDSTNLLRDLIRIPSFSKEENQTADTIERFLQQRGVRTFRKMNNVWAYNKFFDATKPTILLNSHHDTVKPNTGYTRNPFSPRSEEHTSELQSLMRISYAVFCLKKKINTTNYIQ